MPQTGTPLPQPFGRGGLIAMSQRSLATAFDAQRHLVRHVSAIGVETFRFLDHRLEQDRRLAADLARCAGPVEAQALCSAFFESAAKDYAEEGSRLLAASVDAWAEGLQDVEREVEALTEPEPAPPAGD